MSTILITVLIFLAGQGLRSYLKVKGSCGDCKVFPAPSKTKCTNRIATSKELVCTRNQT